MLEQKITTNKSIKEKIRIITKILGKTKNHNYTHDGGDFAGVFYIECENSKFKSKKLDLDYYKILFDDNSGREKVSIKQKKERKYFFGINPINFNDYDIVYEQKTNFDKNGQINSKISISKNKKSWIDEINSLYDLALSAIR